MRLLELDARIRRLQAIADRNGPCTVVVTFKDGSSITTDPAGAIDIYQERGMVGEVSDFVPDRPEYAGLCCTLTLMSNPMPNRRLEDYE